MGRKCLTGCGTAMFTPFRDGKVDVPSLIRQTREQVEAGMDFLVPLGTTGETPTLSDEEKLLVFRTVKAHSGILPVMVGVGTNSFEGTLSNMRLLAEADAYLVVVPYYNKPPQRGLLAYFQGLAAETSPFPGQRTSSASRRLPAAGTRSSRFSKALRRISPSCPATMTIHFF